MILKKIRHNFIVGFLNGIVILLPAVITIALIRFLVLKVNSMVLNPIMRLIAPLAGGGEHVYIAKIIIFFIVILMMSLIGWGAKVLFINRFFSIGEKLLLKLPIMGKIYNAIKQISSAFLGEGKTIFKHVVLFEYPRKGLYSIAFTTGTVKGEIKEKIEKTSISLFVPTTPNPTSGIFLVAPEDEVQLLEMTVEEGMKLVVSGGSVTPHYKGQIVEVEEAEE